MSLPIWLSLLNLSAIKDVSREYGLQVELVAAMASIESSGNPKTTRYEPHYKYVYKIEEFAKSLNITNETEEVQQKTSFGMLQIMGANSRVLGFNGHLSELSQTKKGLRYACKYLKNLLDKYGNVADAVASYNAGSPIKKLDGKYINQDYIDKVIRRYNYLIELNQL